jgi:hypothetical protein
MIAVGRVGTVGRVGSSGQEGWSKRGLGHVAVWLAFVPCHCGESTLTRRPYGSHACLPATYLYYSTVHGPTLLPLSLTLLAARCSLLAARCLVAPRPSSIRSAP